MSVTCADTVINNNNHNNSQFTLREDDVIRLVLEFLGNRDLSISQLSVERETGLSNHVFSDDLLFLRQLILDGQWDDVLHFVQPLESVDTFDKKQFKYLIHKHKYIELLCIRSEAGPIHNVEVAVNDVVNCLSNLEELCPNRDDYNEMCLLLTIPNICELKEYKRWNPSNWRISCFKAVLQLIEKYLPIDKKSANASQKTAKGDRLMQLVIKGILYESCVEYCRQKADDVSGGKIVSQMKYSDILDGTGFSNSDASLLSWLQSIPIDTFNHPFEQKKLNVEVEQLDKPSLMASWSEVILVTPIKPKVFPHSATPFTRKKASDLMSKSLTPGLVDALTKSVMNFSISDMTAMSRSSYASTGFHLNSNNNNTQNNSNCITNNNNNTSAANNSNNNNNTGRSV
ncbi:WD repeat-containing protein 47-like [Oppia nitens]|uniref:WD repeat-containing protein 47-like n=1 Tax=Oppia nitens TaxID=1686743 RepID=UPI0023DA14D7|nr:WD repeat-containing protein 47-like [Oppia nitens]